MTVSSSMSNIEARTPWPTAANSHELIDSTPTAYMPSIAPPQGQPTPNLNAHVSS